MGFAPHPQLAACLDVLYRATISARMLGYEGHDAGLPSNKCDQLAALIDAVHNIPHLVGDWDRCDESLLRGMLDDCDKLWTGGLLDAYDRKIAEYSKP
jgi:hypothetical protein